MAKTVWATVDRVWCDRMEAEADLLEERVYPEGPLPDVGAPFQVRARKCSFAVICNMAGYSCRWAWTNPNHDPFAS